MRRVVRVSVTLAPLLVVALAPAAALGGTVDQVGPGPETPPALPGATVRVPADAPSIQAAVDAAEPGGLVLVAPGVYPEAVVVRTPFVTIRGEERAGVVLDGGSTLDVGIEVLEADGVAVENLTVRGYREAGVAWITVLGFRASYLTAEANGGDGLVAERSRHGQFDRSSANGNGGSGFMVSACGRCDVVVTDVTALGNAIGLEASHLDGELFVVNSTFDANDLGIRADDGVRDVVVAGNRVASSAGRAGVGVLLAGGAGSLATQNVVTGSERYGIAIVPGGGDVGTSVRDNAVLGSGVADLVLEWPSAGDDCFSGNEHARSVPPGIELLHGCGSWLRELVGGGAAEIDAARVEAPTLTPPRDVEGTMPAAESAPPFPAVAGVVPERIRIEDARGDGSAAGGGGGVEPIVMGLAGAASWPATLFAIYAYVLPIVLYCAWVSVALWDLARQDAVPNRVRVGWMTAILAVPVLGPIAYFAFGRSPIQPSLRLMLVAGGLVVYAIVAAIAVVFAGP